MFKDKNLKYILAAAFVTIVLFVVINICLVYPTFSGIILKNITANAATEQKAALDKALLNAQLIVFATAAVLLSALLFASVKAGRNIARCKTVEEKLRQSEDRFRTILDGSQDVMIAVDQACQIIIFNTDAEKMFGRNAEEMLGKHLECRMPEQFRQKHLPGLADNEKHRTYLETETDDASTKTIRRKALTKVLNQLLESPAGNSRPPSRSESSSDGDPQSSAVTDRMPIDIDAVVREFGGDRTLINTVIERFIEDAEEQIDALHKAIADHDGESLRREAHKIRGAAANLTASALAEAAGSIEALAESQEFEEATERLEKLKQEFERLKEACSSQSIQI